jgi:hypothetical protein
MIYNYVYKTSESFCYYLKVNVIILQTAALRNIGVSQDVTMTYLCLQLRRELPRQADFRLSGLDRLKSISVASRSTAKCSS